MNSNTLKQYCQYLMSRYSDINKHTEDGRLYIDMKQFVNEGRIKDLFDKTAKEETKINFLHLFRKDILFFSNNQYNKRLNIKKFNTFLKLKK